MSEINSRNLLEYDSIPTYISPTKFKYFLQCLFITIMGDEEKITKNVFYKLFPSDEKWFHTTRCSNVTVG